MLKAELRLAMKQVLRNLTDRSGRSAAVWQNLERFEEFQDAILSQKTIAVYVNLATEVETARFFGKIMGQIAVPYCENGQLELFRLKTLDELVPQTLGILEPKPELRADASRRVSPQELALVLTPGLAFDRSGGRLGRGAGYYDRFFARIDSEREEPVPKFALAFDCQILDTIPVEPHDIRLDGIITESEIIRIV
ncbi:MAG: 5-formyltetrahydrofolate cyclo-ligase [Planctomycetaceae bacterium]|nr:5-formyltetrahydrofolate cyclo-ligase [Planctomycetaceae bacterium]